MPKMRRCAMKIPHEPFPSCLCIDETIAKLNSAISAMSAGDNQNAAAIMEECKKDVDGYREIHRNMRNWGKAWKRAYLSNVKVSHE